VDPAPDRAIAELLAGEVEAQQRQLVALTNTFDELVAAADLEPPDDEHDPDGTTAYERAQVISLIEITKDRLDRLSAAQHRLDAGTYGRCEICGGPIAAARLEAIPEATTCVVCARR
jgi:RNA polymerase-binding transcription factor DksA